MHFYVSLALIFKLCLYVTHIYTFTRVNCGAEITIQYALSVVTKVWIASFLHLSYAQIYTQLLVIKHWQLLYKLLNQTQV